MRFNVFFYFETFLKAMPVSVVESPLAEMTPACLNHLSDWLSLMVDPSAALSPNLEKLTNLLFSTAASAMIYINNHLSLSTTENSQVSLPFICLLLKFSPHWEASGDVSLASSQQWRQSSGVC